MALLCPVCLHLRHRYNKSKNRCRCNIRGGYFWRQRTWVLGRASRLTQGEVQIPEFAGYISLGSGHNRTGTCDLSNRLDRSLWSRTVRHLYLMMLRGGEGLPLSYLRISRGQARALTVVCAKVFSLDALVSLLSRNRD